MQENEQPTELSGNAAADVLMVLEFLHTFKDAIFIGNNNIEIINSTSEM